METTNNTTLSPAPVSGYRQRQKEFRAIVVEQYRLIRREHPEESRNWCVDQVRVRVYNITGELRTNQGLTYILKRAGVYDEDTESTPSV